MVRTLVAWDDPVLYQPTNSIDFNDPETSAYLSILIDDLKSAVIHYGGYGLSANQIGYNASVFVISIGKEFLTFVNPKITFFSTEEVLMDEGCLSFPGLVGKIPRSTNIRVRYQNISGDTEAKQFAGLTARVIQHEMRHIEGRPFFAGFSKFKIDRMVKKAANKVGVKYSALELSKL